ncbi:MAG: hypothetical protein KGI50_01595 [Patescibacteria group bacterium]|nr:hypothetical protein [Patescibacteria group bacterium]MDE2437963.1 hypothetical protein [Patescibacteria group bacterium]
MPCNIGVKSYAKIEIPQPQPQTFSSKTEAPAIDADLLEKLGQEDSVFLQWIRELDTKPLLEEALKRALLNMKGSGIDFRINASGMLETKGSFVTPQEKKALQIRAAAVSDRWQMEILGIVTQLLGYAHTLTVRGEETILEAEDEGKAHPCKYIKVTRRNNASSFVFEHFTSRSALDVEMAKFLLLADRLGVKVAVRDKEILEGDPMPVSAHLSHLHTHHEKGG